jgi:hypothetical protein
MNLRSLVFFILFSATSLLAKNENSRIQLLLKTQENWQTLTTPEQIEVCILPSAQSATKHSIDGRYFYKPLPAESSPVLVARLSTDATYLWDSSKLCLPVYNARVRFHRSGHSISIDFCFGCDIARFSRDDAVLGFANFDNAGAEIFESIQAVFPDDDSIISIAAEKKRLESMGEPKARTKPRRPAAR